MNIDRYLHRFAKPGFAAGPALAISLFGAAGCRADDTPAPKAAVTQAIAPAGNGVWLGHAYVTTQSWATTRVPALAADMKSKKVTYLFINIGKLDATGKLVKAEYNTGKAATFLNSLQQWETANNYRFQVFAWLSGSVDMTKPDAVNVADEAVRADIIAESRKLAFAAPDGYIAGAQREFDGVQLDLEPSGADVERFNQLKTLMTDLRKGLGKGKFTSYCAHKLGTQNRYWWSPTFYHYMARYVDVLCAMTYDSGLKDGAAYETWMAQQTKDILGAVSGATWKNDTSHPAPKNVKVLIGLPAFPVNPFHDVAVETVAHAAAGVRTATAELAASNDASSPYFAGVAMYLHTDGSGTDHYAGPDDWAAYQSEWLKSP